MTAYSHSRLSTFEKCRFQYKLKYIDRVKIELRTIEGFLGSRVHETLEHLHKDANLGKVDTLETTLAYFNEKWDENWNEDVKIVDPGLDAVHYRVRGERYVREYHKRFLDGVSGDMKIVSLEQKNKLNMSDGNDYYVMIDKLGCVGGTYFVCDYKTTVHLITQEKATTDRQLALYALWVHETYPDVERVVQRWHMLHFDKDIDVEHTREELVSVKAKVIVLIAEIERCTDFPTTTSSLCDYCEYQAMCPEFKHLVHIESLPEKEMGKDEGVRLVNELAAAKAAVKDNEARIEELNEDILRYHESFGADAIYGKENVALISVNETVRLPEGFTEFLRSKELLAKYGQVSFSKVRKAVLSGNAENDVVNAVTRETEKKVTLRKRSMADGPEEGKEQDR